MSNQTAQDIVGKARCYIVEMSNKRNIKCDADELWRVLEAIKTGQPAKLRQGIFNPSFYVDIVEDEERLKEFRAKVFEIDRHNQQDREYHGGRDQRQLPTGVKRLADVFEGTNLRALAKGSDQKNLTEGK